MNLSFFFFNDTATTEIYPLSLHDALPIWRGKRRCGFRRIFPAPVRFLQPVARAFNRSEEHTSELQSRLQLVWRLLLAKIAFLSLLIIQVTFVSVQKAVPVTLAFV